MAKVDGAFDQTMRAVDEAGTKLSTSWSCFDFSRGDADTKFNFHVFL